MSRAEYALPRVAILLSTYNGAKYLSEQLDSLLAQDYLNYVIVVRDDASSDASVDIVSGYAQRHPELFHILPVERANLGACGGFSALLEYVLENKELLGLERAYSMFCDQDDVWHANKVSTTLAAMLDLEQRFPFRACLLHSDLRVVTDGGAEIAPSFFAYQGLRPNKRSFARMLVSNSVTGCTMMVNEKLARLATPIPQGAIMHDWWLALLAASAGHIDTIEEPLIDYRQHQENTVGAKQYQSSGLSLRKIKGLYADPQYDAISEALATQAASFAGLHHRNLKNFDTFVLAAALQMRSKRRCWRNIVLKAFLSLST